MLKKYQRLLIHSYILCYILRVQLYTKLFYLRICHVFGAKAGPVLQCLSVHKAAFLLFFAYCVLHIGQCFQQFKIP